MARHVLVVIVPCLALLLHAACGDDTASGGSSAGGSSPGGASPEGGGGGSLDDWQCGVLVASPTVCDCLHGIAIANADPVPSCEPSCCGLVAPGTEGEGCRCHADPIAAGFASCEDFLANEFREPMTPVASCPTQ